MPKGRTLYVKCHGPKLWVFLVEQFDEHPCETEYGISGETLRIGEISYCMVSPVNIGTAINKVDGACAVLHF